VGDVGIVGKNGRCLSYRIRGKQSLLLALGAIRKGPRGLFEERRNRSFLRAFLNLVNRRVGQGNLAKSLGESVGI